MLYVRTYNIIVTCQQTIMLKTTIADITLDCCIYNASGPRTGSIEALQKVAESKSGSLLFD